MAAMCLSFPLLLFGCSKTDTASLINKRVASEGYGNINLSASEPVVNLNDITSYVGESIDFLSEISISCPDDKIYSLYVDATSVDIWTPGTYGATYELTVDDILYTYDVNVYIIEYVTQIEDSASDSVALDSDKSEDETVITDSGSGVVNSNTLNSTTSNSTTSNSVSSNSGTSNLGSAATTTVSGSSGSGSSTTVTTTTQSSNSSNTSQTTTKASSISATTTTRATRTYVASSTTQAATETQVLNYAKVELLGGGTIQIKQTTGRYIVSTRTDITYQTSGSVTYEISKLIVTYSTGAEQTLETYKRVVSS